MVQWIEAPAVAGIAQHLRDVTPDTSWNRVCKSRAFDGCGTESLSRVESRWWSADFGVNSIPFALHRVQGSEILREICVHK